MSTVSLLERLAEADAKGQVAYTRYLCEQILAESPEHGPTLLRYANALIDLSLYDEAAQALETAMNLVPEKHRHLVHAARGHRLDAMGDHVAAIAEHLRGHDLDPTNAGHLIYAATSARRSGDLTRAESLVRQAIDCVEGCVDEAYYNLGGCLLAKGAYGEARDCYQKALEIDPEYELAKKRLEDVELVLAAVRLEEG
ncbi:MAG: tetratricopeptide repeat protein [Verrucomicrobium sp.]